jgi:predicted DNA-binding transcriptional regulator AlpA
MMRSDGSGEPVVRLLYRISEAALTLGLSRAKVYELINSLVFPSFAVAEGPGPPK